MDVLILQIFNFIEMLFWLIVGGGFFVKGFGRNNRYKKLFCFLSVFFVAFGISDGVEVHTGAWYRPWWLLLWKALCIAIFVISWMYYLRNEKRLKMLNKPNV